MKSREIGRERERVSGATTKTEKRKENASSHLLQQHRGPAEERVLARVLHRAVDLPAHDSRAHLRRAAALDGDRERLSGQGGRVDVDLPLVDDAVGRHRGTRGEQHEVARNDAAGVDVVPDAVALDGRERLERGLERGDGVGGLDGLVPADGGVDELDGEEDGLV